MTPEDGVPLLSAASEDLGPSLGSPPSAELVLGAPVDTESRSLVFPDSFLAGAPLPPDRHPALVYLAALAPGSRRTLRGALALVADWSGGFSLESMPWHALRYQHVQALRARLTEAYSYRTTNKTLSAIRNVLREAVNLGLMSFEDGERACRVKDVAGFSVPKGRLLTEPERHAVYGVCDLGTALGARDAAYFTLGYHAGPRVSEATQLELANIRFEETGAEILFLGKGNKERTSFVDSTVLPFFRSWLTLRGSDPGPFLLGVDKHNRIHAGKHLSHGALWTICRSLSEKAGIAPFSPHDLRRSCISDLLDAGADITTVASIVGHASVNTTASYDRRGDRAKRKAAALLHVPFKGTQKP